MNKLYNIFFGLDTNALPHVGASPQALANFLNIVWSVVGALSLLVITLAGLRYILSRGDPNSTAQAKNAILYAVIGLIISISGFAIVAFVVGGL